MSRNITLLTPLVEAATAEDRPTEEDAVEALEGRVALVDGTLWPCWSWHGHREPWAGKYKTTGHGSLVVTDLPEGTDRVRFRSDHGQPARHGKLKGTAVESILKKVAGVLRDKGFVGTNYITTPIRKPTCRELLDWERQWNRDISSHRAAVERAVATLKTWRALFTDYRRSLLTFEASFRATVGLHFFREGLA